MSEPKFSPTTEDEYDRLPQVYRDADAEQIYPLKINEVKERTNYAINPSFELGGVPKIGLINEIVNPSFEGRTTGVMETYRNIVTNPRGKTSVVEKVTVRKNFINRSLITGESGTIVQLKADVANHCDIATPGSTQGGGVRFPVSPNDLQNGATYTFSVEVRNPADTPAGISITWGSSEPTEITLEPGAVRRISVSGTENIYLSSNSVGRLVFRNGTKQLYFCKPMIENAGAMLEFFDGLNQVEDTDLVAKWEGDPEASYSVLEGIAVKGWSGVNGVVYWSPSIRRAKLFVPFSGVAGARAESGEAITGTPVTAMARPNTTDKTKWLAKFDGSYPYPEMKDPAGKTITELQYPVVGGSEPPTDSYVGQYWVNDQNSPYRRIQ